MTGALHYTIVRYRPLPETGEFANIGVVVYRPSSGQIAYRLSPRRFARVTKFFDNVDTSVYSETIKILNSELEFLREMASIRNRETVEALFSSYAKGREGVATFSAIRGISGDSADDAAKYLYDRLVRRNLEAPLQRELQMERKIRASLKGAGVSSFRARQLDDDIMPVRLPFVSDRRELSVIKPLAFEQKSTLAIVDHANIWRDRFIYLINKGKLRPERILISIESPEMFQDFSAEDSSMIDAYDIARDRIRELPVTVIEAGDDQRASEEIIAFALQSSGQVARLFN